MLRVGMGIRAHLSILVPEWFIARDRVETMLVGHHEGTFVA